MQRSKATVVRACIALAAFAVPFVQMPVAKADTVTATLVRTIDTSAWSPGAPDPAGVAYLPGSDAIMVADSEVDETTGAGYHGVNVWVRTRVTDQDVYTFTTLAYTSEPTGIAYDPAGAGRLFISSDSGEKLFILLPGGDARFGTNDDTRTTILLAGYGITDPEDVAFNTANGHIYISDGTPVEVWDLDPADGVFGNGNDTISHFDVAVYGGKDSEGLGYDPVRNTLLVMDRGTKRIYETTAAGALVRTINASGITGLQNPSDVEVAPSSTGNGARNYWISDRTVDNGTSSSENDGLLWEVSIPGSGGTDTPPTVTLTAPAEGATVAGTVALAANASDNLGVTRVDWFLDGGTTPISSDTSSAGGWTGSWNSVGTSEGAHTITARATDTIGQTANDANAITVDNVDALPTVTLTAPAEGATVAGSAVPLSANASDDRGVAKVEWFLDANPTPVATDASSTGGWTGTWNSNQTGDGPHTITAKVTDTGNQTANDANAVTVDNLDELPNVELTAPAEGATVAGTVSLAATASDDVSVAKVEWFLDGGATAIATDTAAAGGWTGSWNSASTSNGSHTITAKATDSIGQTRTDANGITVFNDGAPSVTLDAPAEGATVIGSVTLTATAQDDAGVTQVQFLLDGSTSLGIDTNGNDGWTVDWNSSNTTDGSHTITAVATDTGSHTASDTNTFTVDNIDESPTVSLTAPATNATVGGSTVTVSANATDDHQVTQVQFFLDGTTSIGVDSSSAGGWSVSWNTTGATDGTHTLTAVATDNANHATTSTGRNVTVDNTAPAPSILAPTSGSTVIGTTTVSASVTDASTITQVQFFRDATSIGTDTNGADGWSIQWNSTTTGNGSKTLTARATDAVGNTGTSPGVTVNVQNALVLDIAVATGNDDAEQKANNNVVLNSTYLDMMDDAGNTVMSVVGLRFAGVTLPAGADVTKAYIQFTADEASTQATNLRIRGELAPNAGTFTTAKNSLGARSTTSAFADWSSTGWLTRNARTEAQRTPDLSAVIEQIIQQGGWAQGNAVVILIRGNPGGRLVGSAFEGGTANRPVLHIEYSF